MKKIILLITLFWILFQNYIAYSYTSEESQSANNLAIKWIIKDHSDNTELYNLDSPVLRQEIALISRRVSWIKENTNCKNIFNDVSAIKPNDWACKNIEALVENKLISANKSFNPENNISKSEALIMFVKSIWFIDFVIDKNSSKNWQEQVVDFAVKNKIVERFTDYNTEAKRWWIFKIADYSIKIKELRVKAGLWMDKYSDEAKIETKDIITKNNVDIYVEAKDGKLIWAWEYSRLGKSSRGEEAYLGDWWATVTYEVNSNKAGTYYLYIRLSDDGVHSNWSRSATIKVNTKTISYNHISEDTKWWKWFSLWEITLKQWKNIISFKKNKTTSAAFIMNAFKLSIKEITFNTTKEESQYDNNTESAVWTPEFLKLHPRCTDSFRDSIKNARKFNSEIDLKEASQYVDSTSIWYDPCTSIEYKCRDDLKADYTGDGKYTPCYIWTSCYAERKTKLIKCANDSINCKEKAFCGFVTK